MHIFLIGFMGSGKSHWGKIWADKYGLSFFDLDEEIEEKAGSTISEIFKSEGEEYFRELESSTLHSFKDKSNYVLACGGGTPCFNDNIEWMNQQGTTIYLNTSTDTLFNRLKEEKDKRPLIKVLPDAQLYTFIQNKIKEREPYYSKAKIILDEKNITTFELPIN